MKYLQSTFFAPFASSRLCVENVYCLPVLTGATFGLEHLEQVGNQAFNKHQRDQGYQW